MTEEQHKDLHPDLLKALIEHGVELKGVDMSTIIAIAKAVCSVADVVCPIIKGL